VKKRAAHGSFVPVAIARRYALRMTDKQPDYAPISSEAVPWESWGHAERFGVRFRHLTASRLGRDYHVGVALEELAPGKQTAPFHYHMLEEEHVFIFEGELTLRLGEERFLMKPGITSAFRRHARSGTV